MRAGELNLAPHTSELIVSQFCRIDRVVATYRVVLRRSWKHLVVFA